MNEKQTEFGFEVAGGGGGGAARRLPDDFVADWKQTHHGGKPKDLRGARCGRLQVIEPAGRDTHGFIAWKCVCDCGTEKIIGARFLQDARKPVNSCGCLRREQASARGRAHAKHGAWRSKAYAVYHEMIRRCHDPKNKAYAYYGGRGIKVHPAWRGEDGFATWQNYIGERPSAKLTLDRIDNDGDYEPGNVRWATRSQQSSNRRKYACLTNFSDAELLAEVSRRGL